MRMTQPRAGGPPFLPAFARAMATCMVYGDHSPYKFLKIAPSFSFELDLNDIRSAAATAHLPPSRRRIRPAINSHAVSTRKHHGGGRGAAHRQPGARNHSGAAPRRAVAALRPRARVRAGDVTQARSCTPLGVPRHTQLRNRKLQLHLAAHSSSRCSYTLSKYIIITYIPSS